MPPKKPHPDPAAITVGEFTRRVKVLLESHLEPCWIRGEISNLRRQSSGHVYFTLKDDRSQLSCVLFRADALRQTVNLRDGMAVVVFGEVSVYEPRGTHQLICRTVLEEGQGRLQERFEQLKAKLQAEGLFDAERKLPIPDWPETVAVVTSPSGAAIKDFVSVLERRDWRGTVLLAPAKVQGEGAALEIVQALESILSTGRADLVVMMRGGGSLEDLWCFNEEIVARAIAASPVPVISAVGHEIDFTLSDFAADRRAETPTAAAELISSLLLELRERQRGAAEALNRSVDQWLRDQRQSLDWLKRHLEAHHPRAKVEQAHLRLDEIQSRLESLTDNAVRTFGSDLRLLRHRLESAAPDVHITRLKERLAELQRRQDRAQEELLRRKQDQLASGRARLEGVSLQSTLKRGFAVARDQHGKVVMRKDGLNEGEVLALDFHDGEIATRIERT
ncbi:MAG: exodeoxyribonuclease VII large subunit [Verrucomicrobiota bacterium]